MMSFWLSPKEPSLTIPSKHAACFFFFFFFSAEFAPVRAPYRSTSHIGFPKRRSSRAMLRVGYDSKSPRSELRRKLLSPMSLQVNHSVRLLEPYPFSRQLVAADHLEETLQLGLNTGFRWGLCPTAFLVFQLLQNKAPKPRGFCPRNQAVRCSHRSPLRSGHTAVDSCLRSTDLDSNNMQNRDHRCHWASGFCWLRFFCARKNGDQFCC